MANTSIQVKKSATSGNVPATLNYGELALNYADGKLYYKNASGVITYISGASINSFSTINVSSSLILATSNTDTLTILGNNGVAAIACTTTKTITFDGSSVYNQANAAYNAQNITASFANSAYALANSVASNPIDNVARAIAASAGVFANGAFDRANSAYASGNITASFANSAYSTANSAASFANGAFTVANNANAIYASGGTIAGPVSITDTTGSTTYSSGALVVTGGVGIGQNLNVYGNTILSGSLTVLGPEVIASSSVTTYQNPYISLHTPATGYLLSDDGKDIGIDFEYYGTTSVSTRVILSGSANGTIATINVSDSSYFAPNTSVVISGVSPSNFNGTFNVLTASPGQLTYALAYTGTINTSGQLGTLYRITNLNITGGSTVNGSKISTVTFTPAITVPVGATVTIAGCTPTGYNGTWTVTASSAGSISYNNNSNLSNITVNGYITLDNRRAFFGRADDTGAFEFYRTGTWSPAGQFEGIYGTIKASRFWANPSQGSPAADILNGFFTIQNESIYDTTSVANVVNGQVAVANLGILTVSSVNTNVTFSGAATLRIQGPPVAGNNISFGTQVYSIQVDSGNSYFGGNIILDGGSTSGIIFNDGTRQTTNAATYTYSVSSYNQANLAFTQANSAFTQANVAYSAQNTTAGFANAAYSAQNTTAIFANSAFTTANSAASFANGAFLAANSAASFANSAYSLANSYNIIANTLITSTTSSNQVAMLYSSTTYRTSRVVAQITSGTSYQTSQLSIIHDGTNTYMTQYGDIYTSGSALGTFDSNISGGYLQLLFTPVNSVTTVKLSTTLIPI